MALFSHAESLYRTFERTTSTIRDTLGVIDQAQCLSPRTPTVRKIREESSRVSFDGNPGSRTDSQALAESSSPEPFPLPVVLFLPFLAQSRPVSRACLPDPLGGLPRIPGAKRRGLPRRGCCRVTLDRNGGALERRAVHRFPSVFDGRAVISGGLPHDQPRRPPRVVKFISGHRMSYGSTIGQRGMRYPRRTGTGPRFR
jgi:hypothetical protein